MDDFYHCSSSSSSSIASLGSSSGGSGSIDDENTLLERHACPSMNSQQIRMTHPPFLLVPVIVVITMSMRVNGSKYNLESSVTEGSKQYW